MVLFFPSNYYCVRASKSRSTRFVMRSSLPMFSRWFPILLVGCCLVLRTDATLPFNISNPTKLLCYSCKGSRCETIANEDDNVILCDKHTQLCWVRSSIPRLLTRRKHPFAFSSGRLRRPATLSNVFQSLLHSGRRLTRQ